MSTKVLMIFVAIVMLAGAYAMRFVHLYDVSDPNYDEFVRRQRMGIVDEPEKGVDAKAPASTTGHTHPTKPVNTVVGPDGRVVLASVQAGEISDSATQPVEETFRSKFFAEGQPMEGVYVYDPEPGEADANGPKAATLILHENCTFCERTTTADPAAKPVERSGKYHLFNNTLEMTYTGGAGHEEKISRPVYPIGSEDMYGRPRKMYVDGRIYRLERE